MSKTAAVASATASLLASSPSGHHRSRKPRQRPTTSPPRERPQPGYAGAAVSYARSCPQRCPPGTTSAARGHPRASARRHPPPRARAHAGRPRLGRERLRRRLQGRAGRAPDDQRRAADHALDPVRPGPWHLSRACTGAEHPPAIRRRPSRGARAERAQPVWVHQNGHGLLDDGYGDGRVAKPK